MRKHFYIILFLLGLFSGLSAQNKAIKPSTYRYICFYTINKEKFDDYLKMKEAILDENYSLLWSALRRMRADLKKFNLNEHNRAFELWYIGNYTDFEAQVETAKQSTLNSLKTYESRVKSRDALYYDHRMFLEQYLAFTTEEFYPDFWFMSMERYFSQKTVDRIQKMNKEGDKLFKNSEFFRPFDIFNELARSEEADIRDYLDMDRLIMDTTTFIPYSYVLLDHGIASYILKTITLDDATQDIDTDRQVNALKKFLKKAESGTIFLVARLNLLELRRLKEVKKKEENEISGG